MSHGCRQGIYTGTFLNKRVRRCVCDLKGGSGAAQRSEGTGEKRDQHTWLKARKLILKQQEVSYLNGHHTICYSGGVGVECVG